MNERSAWTFQRIKVVCRSDTVLCWTSCFKWIHNLRGVPSREHRDWCGCPLSSTMLGKVEETTKIDYSTRILELQYRNLSISFMDQDICYSDFYWEIIRCLRQNIRRTNLNFGVKLQHNYVTAHSEITTVSKQHAHHLTLMLFITIFLFPKMNIHVTQSFITMEPIHLIEFLDIQLNTFGPRQVNRNDLRKFFDSQKVCWQSNAKGDYLKVTRVKFKLWCAVKHFWHSPGTYWLIPILMLVSLLQTISSYVF